MIGATRSELHGAPAEADERLLQATGESRVAEVLVSFPDGRALWTMRSEVATRLADGSKYVISVDVDITERRRAEQALRETILRLEVLNAISRAMTAGAAIDEIRAIAVHELSLVLRGRLVALCEVGTDGRLVSLAHAMPEGVDCAVGTNAEQRQASGIVAALRTGELVRVDDNSRDTRWEGQRLTIGDAPVAAFLDAPIRAGGDGLFAVLRVASTVVHTWTDQEATIVTEVSKTLAVAEIDARTEAERRRVETELRDPESRLRTIVWAADLDVWSWDLRANRLTISPSGISRGEQRGGLSNSMPPRSWSTCTLTTGSAWTPRSVGPSTPPTSTTNSSTESGRRTARTSTTSPVPMSVATPVARQ